MQKHRAPALKVTQLAPPFLASQCGPEIGFRFRPHDFGLRSPRPGQSGCSWSSRFPAKRLIMLLLMNPFSAYRGSDNEEDDITFKMSAANRCTNMQFANDERPSIPRLAPGDEYSDALPDGKRWSVCPLICDAKSLPRSCNMLSNSLCDFNQINSSQTPRFDHDLWTAYYT